MHTLPEDAQRSIKDALEDDEQRRAQAGEIAQSLSQEQLAEVSPAATAGSSDSAETADSASGRG